MVTPHVIAYNAQKPEKFPIFPKYGEHAAGRRYAELARRLGFWNGDPAGEEAPQGVRALIAAVRGLCSALSIPRSVRECGVEEEAFLAGLPALAERAFDDQCTVANPRYPLVADLEEICRRAYYGREPEA
ncbi:MAG: iron-containing alcohol dehydrogenase [Deltaproteobacteria bacterium]|jgi:acetaldehyde dehydrogenase/alcohol dehydrogenase|nr:iron-containing alcohol dehydrogenase [Deltaproteobacteria bacterium]